MPQRRPPLSPPRLSPSRLRYLLGALFGAWLLAGCAQDARGVQDRAVQFDQIVFHVVDIDLRRHPLTLHWRDPASGSAFASIDALQRWGERHGKHLLFAANAGIYDANGAPLGLYVESGRTLVPLNTAHGNPRSGNFSLLPNGVFAIDAAGHASVRTTAAFDAAAAHPQWATQSGPMLVIDGALNPQFIADSDSVKWRSGVCAPSPDRVVFAISEAPVNFHTFARLFRDKLGCRDALYLDGTISQLYVDGNYFGPPAFVVKPYAGMFAVFEDR
jgi:uncharacterized protein YigE (DUF2233 family)